MPGQEGSSPPTRGCSARPRRRPQGWDVLPADAGVFRRALSPCRGRRGPPRRRGGVPQAGWHTTEAWTSSPPTRGCSGHDPGQDHRALVLPADAGVFRGSRRGWWAASCPPRRRGGVPLSQPLPWGHLASSPPTRGCSAQFAGQGLQGHVLPADAGVFRRHWPAGRSGAGPPRRRGGVPPRPTGCSWSAASSPPTRGCSAARHVRQGVRRVLPADAGVFRSPRGPRSPRPRPPRRRGGVPPRRVGAGCVRPSSPPTRGCSVTVTRYRPLAMVLPADAGVFRSPRTWRPTRTRPPRRRGGVPPAQWATSPFMTSSPPTRGCSALPAWAPRGPAVLPADAGVFRTSRSRAGVSSSPPRRRGGVPRGWSLADGSDQSSPPTRGCSVPEDDRDLPDLVLPADAGVFRAGSRRRRPGAGPPRRRGGVPEIIGDAIRNAASFPPMRGCSAEGEPRTTCPHVLPADAGVFRPLGRPGPVPYRLPADAGCSAPRGLAMYAGVSSSPRPGVA